MRTIIMLATILWASVAWGDYATSNECVSLQYNKMMEMGILTWEPWTVEECHEWVERQPKHKENLIKQFAESGEICEVLGHRWHTTDDLSKPCESACYMEKQGRRYCLICDKLQSKDWQDVN